MNGGFAGSLVELGTDALGVDVRTLERVVADTEDVAAPDSDVRVRATRDGLNRSPPRCLVCLVFGELRSAATLLLPMTVPMRFMRRVREERTV